MSTTNPFPCGQCSERKVNLSHLGYEVGDCTRLADNPEFCVINYDDPHANLPHMQLMEAALPADALSGQKAIISATQKATILAIVNIFETGLVLGDYSQVTLLDGDSGHLTYGRSQTTLATGNLGKLVALYCQVAGARFDCLLTPYLQRLHDKDTGLDHDHRFKNILRAAADDPAMRDTQDAFFDTAYWMPALRAAAKRGITTPLGTATVYDSIVHGSWDRIADLTDKDVGPTQGNEKKWITAYIARRLAWLSNHPNQLLRKTRYRMDALGALAAQDKWGLPLPLVVRGHEISLASLNALPQNCYDGPAPGSRRLGLQSPLCRGYDVRLVQLALSLNGIELTADGIFGDGTRQALSDYQKRQKQPPTGTLEAAQVAAMAQLA